MCHHCTNPNLRPAMMDHRRWAFYNLGAQMCGSSGLAVHGPREADRWRWCIAPALDRQHGFNGYCPQCGLSVAASTDCPNAAL